MVKAKYLLLDCDNTLCQSEHLAFEACADLTNELLAEKGIKDVHYTAESLLEDFVGHNFRNMLKGLQKKHGFTMADDELEDYVSRELGRVTQKLSEKCVECPGVTQQLEWAKRQGYPMSVVSTSAKPRVIASLQKTNLLRFFSEEHVYSAATSLNPPSSKPDPKIYLYACEQLGVKPEEVITVEDSKSGATAAMRAGIPCIAYVGIYKLEEGEKKEKQMAELLTTETQCKTVMYDWKEVSKLSWQMVDRDELLLTKPNSSRSASRRLRRLCKGAHGTVS
jgi:HAD superfamily hydrolase (TIGR01509 family)